MNKMENFSNIPCSEVNKSAVKKKSDSVEILCPLTKNEIISNNCANCKYVQMINSKHNSGRTLTTLICLFGLNNEGE